MEAGKWAKKAGACIHPIWKGKLYRCTTCDNVEWRRGKGGIIVHYCRRESTANTSCCHPALHDGSNGRYGSSSNSGSSPRSKLHSTLYTHTTRVTCVWNIDWSVMESTTLWSIEWEGYIEKGNEAAQVGSSSGALWPALHQLSSRRPQNHKTAAE